MTRQQADLLFLLGLPGAIGLLLGFDHAGIGYYLPWYASVGFWLVATLGCWLFFHLSTLGVAGVLRPWAPPLLVVLLAGMVVASLPARIYVNALVHAVEPLMLHGREARPLPPVEWSLPFALAYLKSWAGPFTVWLSATLVFELVLKVPRYGRTPLPKPAGPAPYPGTAPGADLPRFAERLPSHLRHGIVAVKAEDHYLRVFAGAGDGLILYRLTDALADLERAGVEGLRTHRSYWVAPSAVAEARLHERSASLLMTTGLRVPVSQTYKEAVRMALAGRAAGGARAASRGMAAAGAADLPLAAGFARRQA